jgi:alpha-glucosidase
MHFYPEGYRVDSVNHTLSGLTASLSLAGPECNAFGRDIHQLVLSVTHETESRLHVHIYDEVKRQFQIPESTLKSSGGKIAKEQSDLEARRLSISIYKFP